MQYNFSTAEESTEDLMENDVFGTMVEAVNRKTTGPMHGYASMGSMYDLANVQLSVHF